MKFVADLHIHSHFSRATSKDLTLEHLARWAQLKGVHVVGTGDIAHPGWLQEMRARLQPAEEGLFCLKDDLAAAVQQTVPPACQAPVRFLLGGEISSIYKKHGQTRKVHNVIFAPDFDSMAKIQAALEKIGNIRADGRPILGLDARDLLEIILTINPACHLIPAHIWTPWFALLGSKSGFDSVEECFGDLTPAIFALETGLSSDPPMNWRISNLDRYTLVSNSDAHSPQKLAREATLFDTELSYAALFRALQTGDPATFRGTVEFFPEEGKYHLDGHRKCNVCWEPATTRAHQGLCPVCGKEVTIGVMHRVEALADRPPGERPPRAAPFVSLIPLPEILGQVQGVGAASRQVEEKFSKLLARLGPELAILQTAPLADIARAGGERLAAGIGRMRRGEVQAEAGYDGEYGVIRLFPVAGVLPVGAAASEAQASFQEALFAIEAQPVMDNEPVVASPAVTAAEAARLATKDDTRSLRRVAEPGPEERSPAAPGAARLLAPLNAEQRAAVAHTDGPLIIVAGPGTGKTRTLTVRIAALIQAQQAAPESILAITFTNKAAQEMAARLSDLLGAEITRRITIKTFHAFGAWLLRQWGATLAISPEFVICGDEERRSLLAQAAPELRLSERDAFLAWISEAKNRLLAPSAPELNAISDDARLADIYRRYEAARQRSQALDFDDLIYQAVCLLETQQAVRQQAHERFRWLAVDEYQDINLAQYRLLRLLTEGGANLAVIGDPDQAIYGFRGADRRFFLSFEQDFPGARRLHLAQNYRSTQLILDAAMQVIAQGGSERPTLQAVQPLAAFVQQVRIEILHTPTDRAEAETVVHQIEQMVGGTSYFSLDSGRVGDSPIAPRAFADFAVLYRLGAQSRLLVEAFARSGIPYQHVGQTPLLQQPAVRLVLAYLWLRLQPRAQIHLESVLAAGKGAFASGAFNRLWSSLAGQPQGLAQALRHAAMADGFSASQQQRLLSLAAFWETPELAHDQSVADLIEAVYRLACSQASLSGEPDEAEQIARLARRAAPFDQDLAAFLENAALQGETDTYDPRADCVTLMTLHASKGLEFPVVFIVGCEESLLPYTRPGADRAAGSGQQPQDITVEEERRLFYVGMTRAQQHLVLTNARARVLFGQSRQNAPSRFLDDIAAALKALRALERPPLRPTPANVQLALF
jgi:uncharacterized protein (TIGR00375 family)